MSWWVGHFWKQGVFEFEITALFYLIYYLSSEDDTLA